jgi:hypothetical protein
VITFDPPIVGLHPTHPWTVPMPPLHEWSWAIPTRMGGVQVISPMRMVQVAYHMTEQRTNRKVKRQRCKEARRQRLRGGVGDLQFSIQYRARKGFDAALDRLMLFGDR